MIRWLALTTATLALASGTPPKAPVAPAGKLFTSNVLSGSVMAVDLKTGRILNETRTGAIPHTLLLSPDASRLFVSHISSPNIAVLDTASGEKVRDLDLGPAITGLNAMAFTPDQKHLLVTETKLRAVTRLDPATGAVLDRYPFDLPGRVTPAHIVVHPYTEEIWIFHRYEDFINDAQARRHPPRQAYAGQHPSWVTIHSPDFKREIKRLEMDWEVPSSTALSPDGRRLYVSYRSTNRIAVFDTASRSMITSFATGVAPTGIALSPDGRELYVPCSFAIPPVVQAIDAHTGTIRASWGVPPTPLMAAVESATGHVYVTLAGSNRAIAIDPVNPRILAEHATGHQPLDLVLTP